MKGTILIAAFAFFMGLIVMRSCGKSIVFDDIQSTREHKTDSLLHELALSNSMNDSLQYENDSIIIAHSIEIDSLQTALTAANTARSTIINTSKNRHRDAKAIDNYRLLSTADDNATWAIRHLRQRLSTQ